MYEKPNFLENKRFWLNVLTVIVFLASLDVLATESDQTNAATPEFKQVAFDEGMKNQLIRSMPLTLGFPNAYEMLVLDPAIYGVMWGLPNDLEEIKRSKSVPAIAGVFHGRLTPRVGYVRSKQSFICGPECGEADMADQLRKEGVKDLKMEKAIANKIPLLFIEADTSELKQLTSKEKNLFSKKIYMVYIATLMDTNVMLISYRPPINSKDQGKATWEYFKRTLIKSN